MKLKKCPRCYSEAMEMLETYGICHDCNYNTVEGYVWGRCHDPQHMRLVLAKTNGFPVYEHDFEAASDSVINAYRFSELDKGVVMSCLRRLPAFNRTILFLRFWKEMSAQKIGQLFSLPGEAIQKTLEASYATLRDLCLTDPMFSLAQIRSIIENKIDSAQPIAA